MLSNRKINVAWNFLKILFAIALVWYFLSWVDPNELYDLWERVRITHLLATIGLYSVLTLLKAYMYQQILIEQKTRYTRVLNIVVLQNSISNFLANSAGLASYLALLRLEENVKVRQSGLTFLIIKIGDLFAVWLISIACSFLLWDRVEELHNAILFFLILVGLGFIVFFLALFWRRGFISQTTRFIHWVKLTRYSFFEQVANALDSFAEMPQDVVFHTVYKAFGLTFVYTVITLLWMIVSMNAFQLPIDALSILFVSCILQLFSMIPVSVFGGLGITEVTSLYLYTLLGVPGTELSIILVGWRILYYVTNLLLVIYLPIYALFIEPKIPSK
ncbi:hypothetical protein ANAEL_01763 [Anaerolineales bacterium]|nr:hypothetical protein ANAEL_01763 [Anaerolineales bacterium]